MHPTNPNEQPLLKQGPTIPELYSRADAADPNSSFDHSLFTPQVLILSMWLSAPLLPAVQPTVQPAHGYHLLVAAVLGSMALVRTVTGAQTWLYSST